MSFEIIPRQTKLRRYFVNWLSTFAGGPANVFVLISIGIPDEVVDAVKERTGELGGPTRWRE